MNQKVKLGLFLLGATVFNIVLIIVIGFGLYFAVILLVRSVFGETAAASTSPPVFMVSLLAAIVLSFLIYNRTMKWLQAKYQLDKHFPQLFRKK